MAIAEELRFSIWWRDWPLTWIVTTSYMNLAGRAGFGLHHVQILPDVYINSVSPNIAEVGNAANIELSGDGFDKLPKYKRHPI